MSQPSASGRRPGANHQVAQVALTLKARALASVAVLASVLALPPHGAATSGEDGGYGAVAGGQYHTILSTPQGAVWAWGDNLYGALGDGTTTDRYVPGLVTAVAGVKAVAASGGSSLALEQDGDLWSWGLNGDGQVGDGTITNRTTPYKVLTGVAAMAAGEHHAIAVKSDGTVWAWGDNTQGQLGQGSTSATDQKTPALRVPAIARRTSCATGRVPRITQRMRSHSATCGPGLAA